MMYHLVTESGHKKKYVYRHSKTRGYGLSANIRYAKYFDLETAQKFIAKYPDYNLEIEEAKPAWRREFESLMVDFGLMRYTDGILNEVMDSATEDELQNENLMYARAHKKFMCILNTDRRFA